MNTSNIQPYIPIRWIGSRCLQLILFVLIFSFASSYTRAEIKGPYLPTFIYADQVDTADVSKCRLPYNIFDKLPAKNEKVNWKVIKGKAMINNDSSSTLYMMDMQKDTCILTYTTFDSNKNIKDIDTLVLIDKPIPICEVIDRPFGPGIITCGTINTLYTKLGSGYTYTWISSSPNIQILNQDFLSGKIDFKVLASGNYSLTVNARSPMGWNVLSDTYFFTVNCNTPITPPNAGPDASIYACQFPYTLNGNIPAIGETVKWEVVTGSANVQNANSPNARITDAISGTQLKYTISNGTQSSSDMMILTVNSGTSFTCDPTVTNLNPKCGDNVTINFNWPSTTGYIFQWNLPSHITAVGPLTNNAIVKASKAGVYQIVITIKTPQNLNTFTKIISLNVTCPNSVTIANAGPDQNIWVCNFPYNIYGNLPKAGESAKWEVVPGTGSAVFIISSGNLAVLKDATNGVQLKYTISNGTDSSSDIVVVFINSFPSPFCDPIVSTTNPKCGDTVTIRFDPIVSSNYFFNWNYPPGLLPIGPLNGTAKFKVSASGIYPINVTITSPNFYNSTSKLITLNATCINAATVANAGPDILLSPCQFPFQLNGNKAKPDESVKWEVVSSTGSATIQNENSSNALLLDATKGVQLRYTITNGSQSSSDIMVTNINPNTTPECSPTISNTLPKCGDTVTVQFNLASNYQVSWSYPVGVTPIGVLNTVAKFKINDAGTYAITATIESTNHYNIVYKSFSITSTCTSVTKANAGHDTTAFCQTFHLSGNTPASGEKSIWKLIEGIAKMEDNTKPNTTVFDIESNKLVLVYTISNLSKSSSDTIIILVNKLNVSITNVKDASCGKSNGGAKAQVTGGIAPYQINWQGNIQGSELTNVPTGTYAVRVNDQSGCSVTDSVKIKDDCNTNFLYTVEGHVYGGNQLLPSGLAMLISNINGVPTPINLTYVVNGYYKFEGVLKGDYIVYVLPYKDKDHITLHDKYLPTYYVNKVNIMYANPIHVIGNTYSVDIKLAEKAPAHVGSIHVILTININVNFGGCSNLLPVLLFNQKNELVSYGYYNGTSCEFNNITEGSYYICMATSGSGYNTSELFKVTSNQSTLDVSLDGGKVMSTMEAKSVTANTFPNPFTNKLTIELSEINGAIEVLFLEGVTGKTIKEVQVSSLNDQFVIETEDLPSGFYIIQIKNGDERITTPLIKK